MIELILEFWHSNFYPDFSMYIKCSDLLFNPGITFLCAKQLSLCKFITSPVNYVDVKINSKLFWRRSSAISRIRMKYKIYQKRKQ